MTRFKIAFCLVGLSLFSSGCSMYWAGAYGLSTINRSKHDLLEFVRDRNLAKSVWEEQQLAHPECPHSADYADGFKVGFADHLYAGGTGNPPLLPPQRYRTLRYQTPQGYQAIQEWYAGFAQGAHVAMDSGMRKWITVPVPEGPPPIRCAQATPLIVKPIAPGAAPPPSKPDLPAPRPILPEPAGKKPQAGSGGMPVAPDPQQAANPRAPVAPAPQQAANPRTSVTLNPQQTVSSQAPAMPVAYTIPRPVPFDVNDVRSIPPKSPDASSAAADFPPAAEWRPSPLRRSRSSGGESTDHSPAAAPTIRLAKYEEMLPKIAALSSAGKKMEKPAALTAPSTESRRAPASGATVAGLAAPARQDKDASSFPSEPAQGDWSKNFWSLGPVWSGLLVAAAWFGWVQLARSRQSASDACSPVSHALYLPDPGQRVHAEVLSDLEDTQRGASPPVEAIAGAKPAEPLDSRCVAAFHDREVKPRSQGEHDLVIADCSEAIRLNPQSAPAFANRAAAYSSQGKLDEALADFNEAARLDPSLRLESEQASIHLSRGGSYLKQGAYDLAIADYGDAIRLDPRCAQAFANRGHAFLSKAAYDQAIADYNEAARLEPSLRLEAKQVSAYSSRGGNHLKEGAFDLAVADYSEIIRLDPHNADAFVNRGEAYMNQGAFDQALADYHEAMRLDPSKRLESKQALAYAARAESFVKEGAYDQAIADCGKAFRLDPKCASALVQRGSAYMSKGEYDQAVADFTDAIRLDPKLAGAFGNRGRTHLRNGEYEKAIGDYNEALRIDPKNAVSYISRGFAYWNKGEYDKAIADDTAALRLDASFTDAYVNRSIAYWNKGDYDKSIADGSAALRLDPDCARAYHSRGFAYWNKGEINSARTDWERAVQLDPKLITSVRLG